MHHLYNNAHLMYIQLDDMYNKTQEEEHMNAGLPN